MIQFEISPQQLMGGELFELLPNDQVVWVEQPLYRIYQAWVRTYYPNAYESGGNLPSEGTTWKTGYKPFYSPEEWLLAADDELRFIGMLNVPKGVLWWGTRNANIAPTLLYLRTVNAAGQPLKSG